MKLQARNLSYQAPPIQGDDVKLLQAEFQQLGYAIQADEVESASFGQSTHEAVLDFQATHGLETTGTVDARTASLINRAVDALHPQPEPSLLVVNGAITDQNAHPLSGLIVRAFERGMRSEGLLGEALTDTSGHYQVTYTASQINHTESGPPDLMIRVFTADGRVLGASPTLFDAPPAAVIDLQISIPQQARLSEYEETLGEIMPLRGGVALADLTDDDLAFLFGETRIDPQRLDFVRQAAKLSQKTEIPAEAFYGWAREDLPLILDQLLAFPDATLQAALSKAIDANIIPLALQNSLGDIIRRVDALRNAPTSPTLTELVSTLHLSVPTQLSSFLIQNGINTLADIRKAGSLSHLAGLPVAPDDPIVRTLNGLAALGVISNDVRNNAALIDRGFTTPRRVAQGSATGFTAAVSGVVDAGAAVDLHRRAVAATRAMNEMVFAGQSGAANHYVFRVGHQQPYVPPADCQCEECQSAVAPIAYLADLLDYAVKHLTENGNALTLDGLGTEFHQPFAALLAWCPESEREVREIRIFIEVLRDLTKFQTVPGEEGYRLLAYRALLQQEGVGLDEIRLAHAAPPAARAALAARLGIALSDTAPDELDRLLLVDPALLNPNDGITESKLDELFGLCDTTSARNPLSDGVTRGDSNPPQIARWNFENAVWGRATDSQGVTYVKLTGAGGPILVEVFRHADRAPAHRVGFGTAPSSKDAARIVQDNNSGLSGRIALAFTANTSAIELQVVPQLASWRLRQLRNAAWAAADHGALTLADPDGDRALPIIDPDVIGPDDFRYPYPTIGKSQPFDLWLGRRTWVDAQVADLQDTKNAIDPVTKKVILDPVSGQPVQIPDLDARIAKMQHAVTYAAASRAAWGNGVNDQYFDDRTLDLTGPHNTPAGAKQVADATQKIWQDVGLKPDAFLRFAGLRSKNRLGTPLTDDEGREATDILVQARKTRFLDVWLTEEGPADSPLVPLWPDQFWIPEREPQEGAWPPPATPGLPLVDPDRKAGALADPVSSRRARALVDQRRAQMAADRVQLKATHLSNVAGGFEPLFVFVLGPTGQPWTPQLEALATLRLSAPNAPKTAHQIVDVFGFTLEGFDRVMAIEAKAADPGTPPTPAEWEEAYTILTAAKKVRSHYPAWVTEETAIGLTYWETLKAQRPAWRAPAAVRGAWQALLNAASERPIVEPDLLLPVDFVDARPSDPAFHAFGDRQVWLTKQLATLEQARATAPQGSALAGVDAMTLLGLYGTEAGASPALDEIARALAADRLTQGAPFVIEQVFGTPAVDFGALNTALQNPQTKGDATTRIVEELGLTPLDVPTLVALVAQMNPNQADQRQLATILARATLVRRLLSLTGDDSDETANRAARLAQLGLSSRALAFLLAARRLAAASVLEADEIGQVQSILVQCLKYRTYGRWRDEETRADIVLTPQSFQIAAGDPLVFPPPPPPQVPPWRASLRDRRDWLATLQSRIDAQTGTIDVLASDVSAVEGLALPVLRSALLAQSGVPGLTEEARQTSATRMLVIDAADSGCRRTTRVAQAIETVRALLWGVRGGELTTFHPTLALVTDGDFDSEWAWIGSYGAWRAAMFVNLYPENLCIPNLRPWASRTPGFQQLLATLQASRQLTPAGACQAACTYASYFNDICHLTPEASCLVAARVQRPTNCCNHGVTDQALALLFTVARGPSGAVYWSTFAEGAAAVGAGPDGSTPSGADAIGTQSFWAPIEAFATLEVAKLVGLIPFTNSRTHERWLYLFAAIRDKGKPKLGYVRYSLTNGTWESQLAFLDLPDRVTDFTAVLRQTSAQVTNTEFERPHLALRFSDQSIVHRLLDDDATGWETVDFRTIIDTERGGDYTELLAMVSADAYGGFYLFLRANGGDIRYKLFRRYDTIVYRLCSPSQTYRYYTTDEAKKNSFVHDKGYTREVQSFYVGAARDLFTEPLYRSIEPRDGNESECYLVDQEMGSGAGRNDDGIFGYINRSFKSGVTLTGSSQVLWYLGKSDPPFQRLYTADDVEKNSVLAPGGWHDVDKASGAEIDVIEGRKVTPFNRWHSLGAGAWVGAVPVMSGFAYAFVRNQGVTSHFLIRLDEDASPSAAGALQDVESLAVWCSAGFVAGRLVYIVRSNAGIPGVVSSWVAAVFKPNLISSKAVPLAPSLDWTYVPPSGTELTDRFSVPERLSDLERQDRQAMEAAFYTANLPGLETNLTYLDEVYYFVPVHLALTLQLRGEFVAALDWLRTVYDYAAASDSREIWAWFALDDQPDAGFARITDWLNDPLNPHAIAKIRPRTYLRFTLLAIVRCVLAYADALFTQDTPETVPEAMDLYLLALTLLDELSADAPGCDQQFVIDIGEVPPPVAPQMGILLEESAAIRDQAVRRDLANQVGEVLRSGGPMVDNVSRARGLIRDAVAKVGPSPTLQEIALQREQWLTGLDTQLVAQPPVATLLGRIGTLFSTAGASSPAVTPGGSGDGAGGGAGMGIPALQFCVSTNPMLMALRFHAKVELYKIRTCRNIAGDLRKLDPYAAATDTTTGMPSIGSGRQLVVPGAAQIRPTQYRYATLAERAKQLTQLAAQMESALLAAFEKRDSQAYSQLKARQDLKIANAQVRLQDLQVHQAQDSVQLANLQQTKAQDDATYYQGLLDAGISPLEIAALILMGASVVLDAAAAVADYENELNRGAGAALSALATGVNTVASMLSTLAGYERRAQDWQHHRDQANYDVAISGEQITIAEDHVRIVAQEREIAAMQAQNASDSLNFLVNMFTGVELYEFLIGVYGDVYGYFLTQATAVAKLAENQLAFERQEAPQFVIQADYWTAPSDQAADPNAPAPDRKGLTGSARLLADLTRLDEYAFLTNQRKLQLSKTISLATLRSIEFAQFQETGVLPFQTTLEMFDQEFPGHYLRLIRRVKVSVIALVPPTLGIRATLSTTGISRVVIGGDLFQTVPIRRTPETIAFTGTDNATGLSELDPATADMLRPFEGTGVATSWEFRMPRTANLFDFSSIADVLITIEYSALDSFEYRQQVLRDLSTRVVLDRPFRFRTGLADPWYDLHNPNQTSTPMTVRFTTVQADFPTNLGGLKIEHVTLAYTPADGADITYPETQLRFRPAKEAGAVGGAATPPVNGIVSTRAGNGSVWTPMQGKTPIGDWELALPNVPSVQGLFQTEAIQDMLLVITYSATTPDWPV